MKKKIRILSGLRRTCLYAGLVSITIIFTFYMGCQTKGMQNKLLKEIDILQRQIIEIQQEQVYINAKQDKIFEDILTLNDQTKIQEKKIEEVLKGYRICEEELNKIKESLNTTNSSINKDIGFVDQQREKGVSPNITLSSRNLYETALTLVKSGNSKEAIPFLTQYINLYPRTELADNALYWLGECYYKNQDFILALQYFKKILTDYSNSNKKPDALLKIGFTYYELKQPDLAKESLEEIIKYYYDSPVYKLAKRKMELMLAER